MNISGEKITPFNLVIQEKREDTLKQIINLDHLYIPFPWPEQSWCGVPAVHHSLYLMHDTQSILQGFALFFISPFDDVAHLLKILILPEYRGTGRALRFWRKLEEKLIEKQMKTVYLEVESSNTRAISFYRKCGFETLRENKSYYSNGENALVMLLGLE